MNDNCQYFLFSGWVFSVSIENWKLIIRNVYLLPHSSGIVRLNGWVENYIKQNILISTSFSGTVRRSISLSSGMWSFVSFIPVCLQHDLCCYGDRERGWQGILFYISLFRGQARLYLSCAGVAPMAPGITQSTSYQRDVLYRRLPEIETPHRQPWPGQPLKTTLLVPFSLMDGVIHRWAEGVSAEPPAGYQQPPLCQTLQLPCVCLPPLLLSLFFISLPRPQPVRSSTEHWEAQYGKLKYITFPPCRILIWFTAQFPADMCWHSFCWSIGLKAGGPRELCCGGKRCCYPNRDLRCMDLGQRESQQEGLSHEIPRVGCYCTITLPLYLAQRKEILSSLITGVIQPIFI